MGSKLESKNSDYLETDENGQLKSVLDSNLGLSPNIVEEDLERKPPSYSQVCPPSYFGIILRF